MREMLFCIGHLALHARLRNCNTTSNTRELRFLVRLMEEAFFLQDVTNSSNMHTLYFLFIFLLSVLLSS